MLLNGNGRTAYDYIHTYIHTYMHAYIHTYMYFIYVYLFGLSICMQYYIHRFLKKNELDGKNPPFWVGAWFEEVVEVAINNL